MATKRVFNPTDGPVVIDEEGHVLGGGEWADLDPNDPAVSALVDTGRLLFPDDSSPAPSSAKKNKE